ncbi:MAG: UDP-3-O-(3-hydroxymyristoyl)glucosamine N-acyltransferase [Candidatus Eremiobacteraeota bacterium]|nr:UDP-3-O-(3-hydroxymyristoyl)glucosamine N-acyltransferase [Candidatus Eremiobacteraeota bacterium]
MTLAEYAARVGGTVRGDGAVEIERVAAIDDADDRTLTFAVGGGYLRGALQSRAAAVLTEVALADAAGSATKPLLIVPSVRAALASLLAALEPPRPRRPFRDPSASVDPGAKIGPDVHVGAQAVVAAGAEIGAGSVIMAGAIVGPDARLGRDSTLHPHAMLLAGCVAGDRVVLHAGAVVGADGFGYAFLDDRFLKIPQIGNVVLGDDVEIGANACVDRGQTGSTTIGEGTKIDNLVQIGHNCKIGKHCVFAGMTGLAGSTVVGDYVMVGGQSAFKGHITVGSRVKIAGNTMVWGDVPDDAFVSGQPAHDHRDELRLQVRLRNLDKLFERVKALERNP